MTKLEIIKIIKTKTGQDRSEIETTLNCFFDTLNQSLAEGHTVYFRGFGSFQPKLQMPRRAYDIGKKQEVHVDQWIKPTFKPSNFLIQSINSTPEINSNDLPTYQ